MLPVFNLQSSFVKVTQHGQDYRLQSRCAIFADRFNGIGNTLEALRTWQTMLPRRAERALLGVLREYGATMIDYQSAIIGGEVPGIVPLPPEVIL